MLLYIFRNTYLLRLHHVIRFSIFLNIGGNL